MLRFRGFPLLLAALSLVALWILSSSPARADLVVCNASDRVILTGYAHAWSGDAKLSTQSAGDLPPAACRPVLGVEDGEVMRHYLYTSESGYQGETEAFCFNPDIMEPRDAKDRCDQPGDQMAAFRVIETAQGEPDVFLNLDGAGGYLPAPQMAFVDISRPFTPERRTPEGRGDIAVAAVGGIGGAEAVVATYVDGAEQDAIFAGAVYESGLQTNTYGQPFELDAIWQGCAYLDDVLTCEFYASLVKFTAMDGEAYPQGFLEAVSELPKGAAVRVTGDVIVDEGLEVQVALAFVTVKTDNPFRGIFDALQGQWVAEDDRSQTLTINGSTAEAAGASTHPAQLHLQLGLGCPEDPGLEAPTIQTILVGQYYEACYVINELTDSRLILSADGEVQTLVRP